MLPDHAKLLALLQDAGEVAGRKKWQKIVYISKKLQLPLQEKYTYHMYGPYSEELSMRTEELCSLGFVSEVKETKAGYYQYRYQLTEEGDTFLQNMQLDWPRREAEKITSRLNEYSAKFLELVSTVLYFDELPKEDVKEKVQKLKKSQNYSDEDMEEAWNLIDSLK